MCTSFIWPSYYSHLLPLTISSYCTSCHWPSVHMHLLPLTISPIESPAIDHQNTCTSWHRLSVHLHLPSLSINPLAPQAIDHQSIYTSSPWSSVHLHILLLAISAVRPVSGHQSTCTPWHCLSVHSDRQPLIISPLAHHTIVHQSSHTSCPWPPVHLHFLL